MNKVIRVLTIVAAAQLALVAVTSIGGNHLETAPSGTALLSFEPADVDSIIIAGENNATTKLAKRNGWQTASGFPADGRRIDRLLQRLRELKHGLAVAVSASALPHFKVGEKEFVRHIILNKGNKVASEFYLGKGAGARQSYARSAKDEAVYSVALGSYELPLMESDWQDKTLLQLRSNEITAVKVRGVKLVKTIAVDPRKSGWTSDQTPTGKQLDQVAVTQVLNLLQSLRFTKALGKQAPDGYDMAHPVLSLNVSYQGKKRQYQFAKPDKGDDYVLKVSDRPEYFQLSGYTVKKWRKQMKPAAWFADLPAERPKDHSSANPRSSRVPAKAVTHTQEEKTSRR